MFIYLLMRFDIIAAVNTVKHETMKDKVLFILLFGSSVICQPVLSLFTCQGLSVPKCGRRGHFVIAPQDEPCFEKEALDDDEKKRNEIQTVRESKNTD